MYMYIYIYTYKYIHIYINYYMYISFIYKYHIQHLFSAFPQKKCLEIIRSSSQDGHGRPKKRNASVKRGKPEL